MTTEQAVKRIKLRLGEIKGLGTRIELNDDDVQQLIEMSLDELVDRVDTPSLLVLPYTPIIDVSKYHIARVDCVLREDAPYGVTQGAAVDPFYLSMSAISANNVGKANLNGILQLQATYAVRAMAQNTVQAELVYFHDLFKKTLTVSYSGTAPNYISILYRPEITCVEDLPSHMWETFLIRLAVAHGKIVIGRWREKYSVAGSPITINTGILAEGISERDAIYEELKPLTGRGVV